MSVATLSHDHGACSCSAASLWAGKVRPPLLSGNMPLRSSAPRPLVVPTVADLIIRGRLRTMNPAQPYAEAVAVTDGYITAVGDARDIEGLKGPHTQVITEGDGAVYPGLIEPHMHYWASALFLDWVDCSTRTGTSFDEVVALLAGSAPLEGGWVLGQNFDPALVEGERELTRDILDRAVPDHPCLVMNASMHFIYVNSLALTAAGITEDTPEPPGGFFIKDASGRLTGAIGELTGIQKFLAVLPPTSAEQLGDNVVRINKLAAQRGYTRTHDAGTGMVLGPSEIPLLHTLIPRLQGRITYGVIDYGMDAAREAGLVPFAGDDMVRAIAWKFVSDGSNQGRSGFQRANYLGRDFGGEPNYPLDELASRMTTAHQSGWQLMVHANGDAAIDLALDAYAQALGGASGARLRHRIEHCSFAHPEQLDRMAQLGLSPTFLIGHLYYWGDAFVRNVMGPEKSQLLDPVGGARRRGLRATVHSDYTVTDFEPFREIQTQITRELRVGGQLNPGEAVTAELAVRAKTIDAAWQTHCDDVAGSIEVGKLADFVVLDSDPCAVDSRAIADTAVRRTIVGGNTVYEA